MKVVYRDWISGIADVADDTWQDTKADDTYSDIEQIIWRDNLIEFKNSNTWHYIQPPSVNPAIEEIQLTESDKEKLTDERMGV